MTVAPPHVNTDIGSVGLIVGSGGRRFSGLYPPPSVLPRNGNPGGKPYGGKPPISLEAKPEARLDR